MTAETGRDQFTVSLTLHDGYAFTVDFGDDLAPLAIDESPPLGQGRGPNPARVLAAAVGSCLGASLLFCLRKSHVDVKRLAASVDGTLVRNARGRLRIGTIAVRLKADLAAGQDARWARCLELFQDYCIVTESVRAGIAVDVAVDAAVPQSGSANPRELIPG